MFSILAGLTYLVAIALPLWLLSRYRTAWYWHVLAADCGGSGGAGARHDAAGDDRRHLPLRFRVRLDGRVGHRRVAAVPFAPAKTGLATPGGARTAPA